MKLKKHLMFLSIATALSPVIASATTTTLFAISNYTYAQSSHDDAYLADTYTGTVSVRGADRFYVGNNIAYPTYSQIKYNVQGEISTREVYSRGMNDTSVITGHITVKDKWNNGPKTQVYGNYGYALTGGIATSIPESNS